MIQVTFNFDTALASLSFSPWYFLPQSRMRMNLTIFMKGKSLLKNDHQAPEYFFEGVAFFLKKSSLWKKIGVFNLTLLHQRHKIGQIKSTFFSFLNLTHQRGKGDGKMYVRKQKRKSEK